jgi:hypothetical protein
MSFRPRIWVWPLAALMAAAMSWLGPRHNPAAQDVPAVSQSDGTTRTLKPAAIDGARAYRYLQQICAIGPHPAGSEANAKVRKMVADHFKAAGGQVFEQGFPGRDPATNRTLKFANLIGSWHPERTDRVLVCAHYDTRPHADQETDLIERRKPFIGANDPGSGIALLMEIANHLNTLPADWGIDLVLLDAEELVYGPGSPHELYFLGSKAFGRAYANGLRTKKLGYRYKAGILLDMVGGKDLMIEREPHSLEQAPELVEEVWSVAERLGETTFRRDVGREVYDDHWPLNEAGIPTIDLIDFDYPHWHRASDLPDQLSPASFASVGRVVTAWLSLPRREASADAKR